MSFNWKVARLGISSQCRIVASRPPSTSLNRPPNEISGSQFWSGRGDILFVPKGTWHDVVAIGEPSLHLTISIVYATVSDYARWLLDQHRYGLPFRDIRTEQDAPDMLCFRLHAILQSGDQRCVRGSFPQGLPRKARGVPDPTFLSFTQSRWAR
ncbi:JmjC domain-containing protein [Cupriavidus basilensis]